MNKKILVLLISLLLLCSCNKKEDTNYEIVTFLPLYDEIYDRCKDDTGIGFPSGISHESDLPIAASNILASKLDNVSFKESNNHKNAVINKELIRTIFSYQLIKLISFLCFILIKLINIIYLI